MKKKPISYAKQTIDQSDIKIVAKALKSEFLTQGPYGEFFEKNINKFFGSRYSAVVSNGTAGLFLAGKALGWEKNDVIITSPITFIASANAIINNGAIVDFVDIDKDTYNIDINKLEDKLKKNKKIKSIIAVDYAGHPCDWKSLKYLSNKHKVTLINDNCHSIGAKYMNDFQYAVKFADIVVHSYHPTKNITTGEGGSVLSNNKTIINKIKILRNHSIIKPHSKIKKYPWYYEINEAGFNFRLTEFQCALGISQLKKIKTFIKKRREIAKKYYSILNNKENITLPKEINNSTHAYHLFPLQVNFEKIKLNKSDFFYQMLKQGIKLQVHYIPIHLQPFYKNMYKQNLRFPIAEEFYKKEISLPIYPNLAKNEFNKVIYHLLKLIN
jgi:UDP-4-amino-4,6-dideoxy-L-N-acetyl-beta-L-altrosamine transaminase